MSDEPKGEMPEIKADEAQIAPAVEEVKDDFDKDRAMATIKNLRAFEKEAEKLRKQLADLQAKEDERKKAELTEIERLKLEKQEAESKLAELTLDKQHREIAEKVGLPAIFADRIRGDTLDAMEEDAKKLLDAIPRQKSNVSVTNPGSNAIDKEETRAETARRLGLTY